MVETRRLDFSLVDDLLNGGRTSDLLQYILQNSPLHPDDIDYFVGKVTEVLYSLQSPEKRNEAARILEPVWALVSNNEEIGAEKAKCLLIPLLLLGSDNQHGVANLNWIFHIINILLLKVESLDDIFKDSAVANAVQCFGQTLADTGDYETQVLMVEAMFHIASFDAREFWAKNWFPDQCAFDAFMCFDPSNFEIECRKLLNNLNQGSDKQKVFSVIAQSVIFGGSKVQKPPGQELWVNFNCDSKCISFYCVCPSKVQKIQENLKVLWETILIYSTNIDSSFLTVFPNYGIQELVIKLNCPCTSLINAPASDSPLKGNAIYFLFEEILDIQACMTAVYGEVIQNVAVPNMKSLDSPLKCSESPLERNEYQNKVNGKTQHLSHKASETAVHIIIDQTSNKAAVSNRTAPDCSTDYALNAGKLEATVTKADSQCSSSKASQTAVIIRIAENLSDTGAEVVQNTHFMDNAEENGKCSSVPGNANDNRKSSLSYVSLHKASQSDDCIIIGDYSSESKVVRYSTLSARNHSYVRQVKLNNVIFEQSSSKSSGSVMNSPMSQDEQPKENVSSSQSKYSKDALSPIVKILHFPRTPKESLSPKQNKANEIFHGKAIEPLLQTTPRESADTGKVSSQKLLELAEKVHEQTDAIPVEDTGQLEEQSEIVELPKNGNENGPSSENNNGVNTSSFCEHPKPSLKKTIGLQKDILLECNPAVGQGTENVNKIKKKAIEKNVEVPLETDMLLECTANNVFIENGNDKLHNENAELKPKKHKLFSNNSRVNSELLLNNAAMIEEDDVTTLAKSTYLENISKRQKTKRNKPKSKTVLTSSTVQHDNSFNYVEATPSSTVQHDNSFDYVEGTPSEVPQIQMKDVANGSHPSRKSTFDLEKIDKEKPPVVPLSKLSPEMNFDKASNSKSGIDDSGIGTSTSAEKSSSPGEPDKGKIPEKRPKRKATVKLDNGNKKDSGYSEKKSRKAALDSIKKTRRIMKYSEESSSVDHSLHDISDSEDFVSDKTKKKGGSVLKKSYDKSHIYSLTESDANSETGSSNRRSQVSLFESPVKSYKEWREKQRKKKMPNTKNKGKSKTGTKKHSKGIFFENHVAKSFNNVAKSYHTINKKKSIKKNVLSDFDLLLEKSADLSDIENFKLVVERSAPKHQKVKPPESFSENGKFPMWSPFGRTKIGSEVLNTLKNMEDDDALLQNSHRTYTAKNQVNSSTMMSSSQLPMQGRNSKQKKQSVQETKDINNMQKIVVEADIEDPKEKLKLLRKKLAATHKLKNRNTKVRSPYSDQINFIEVETSRENSAVDAFDNVCMPSTLKNERLRVAKSSSEGSVVEVTVQENVKILRTDQAKAVCDHRSDVDNYFADAELSNMDSGKEIHMKRYLMDVASCSPPEKGVKAQSESSFNLSGKSVISNPNLKRKRFDFCQEAQTSKLKKFSHSRNVKKSDEFVNQKELDKFTQDSFSGMGVQSATKTSEDNDSVSRSKSVVQNILEKYNRRRANGETAGVTLGNAQGPNLKEQMKPAVRHSSSTGDRIPFPAPLTELSPEFKNEHEFEEIPVIREKNNSITSAMQPLILDRAFGEILELSKKYVTSVQKYNSHFCKQLEKHRQSMATYFFRDEFSSTFHHRLNEISDDPIKMSQMLRHNMNNHLKDLRSILDSFQEAEKNLETMMKNMQEKVALKYDSSIREILMKTQTELERKILNDVKQHLSKFEQNYCLFD